MTINRISKPAPRPKPHAYATPHVPSATDAYRARQHAAAQARVQARYARNVVQPDAATVALVRAQPVPHAKPAIKYYDKPAQLPPPASGAGRAWTKRRSAFGSDGYNSPCRRYRVWENDDATWSAGLLLPNGGGRSTDMPGGAGKWTNLPTAEAAMAAVDALIASESAPQPAERAESDEEVLRAAGFGEPNRTGIRDQRSGAQGSVWQCSDGGWYASCATTLRGTRFDTVHAAVAYALSQEPRR